MNRAYLQELVDYWRTDHDWREAEAAINACEHYRATSSFATTMWSMASLPTHASVT